MRIIGGHKRGQTLETPADSHIRPTSDKVRQAVFNMLEARGHVIDMRCLDLFCGTGALGLEALSRGAATCTFFDNAAASLKLAQRNAEKLGLAAQSVFAKQDSFKLEQNSAAPFDLIFIDPPYKDKDLSGLLETLKHHNWLAAGAVLIIETDKATPLTLPFYADHTSKTYGATNIHLIRLED